MKASAIPPYVVIDLSKEVIFYIPKDSETMRDIALWKEKLNLTNYKGMVINSKCMFNRLKNQGCKK